MPRPRSDDKRAAIMSAAARVIATQGLGAPTATIAKEAGVSNGSLFTYFDTKADLFNHLYLDLKADMGAAALGGLPDDGDEHAQLLHMWSGWLRWATAYPEKRRALAQLGVSDEITEPTHLTASLSMAGVAGILERGRAKGPLRDAPLAFVVTLTNALAEATIDFILRDPDHADAHGRAGFDALWRMLA
ncbi:TetR family transcriptional regulator [Streptomyces sp. NPDC008139]|uniref:TetR/AcrR family transcriptional regulator n=1 Tax=Streptomyces sp. NPDC008139 TaxID=3364814 RepID=UPI0036EC398A